MKHRSYLLCCITLFLIFQQGLADTPPDCSLLRPRWPNISQSETTTTLPETFVDHISWHPLDGATGYDLYLGTTELPADPIQWGSGTSFNHNIFTVGTTYQWKVVPKNEHGEATECPIYTFTVVADPDPLLPPYTQDFSPWASTLPAGWIRTNPWWRRINQNNAGGTAPEMYFQVPINPEVDIYRSISPKIQVEPGEQYRLSFRQRVQMNNSTSYPYTLRVLLSNDGKNWSAIWDDETGQHIPAQLFTLSLGDANGDDFYLAWEYEGDPRGISYWSIDNIVVEEAPSCLEPTSLNADNITTTGAQLQWTAGLSETSWNVEIGVKDFTPGTGTALQQITETLQNPLTITGLDFATQYDFYVQAWCSTTQQSSWSEKGTFVTACAPFSITYTEEFDVVTAPALPFCWEAIVNTSTNAFIRTTTAVSPRSAPNQIQMSTGSDAAAQLILIMPELEIPVSGVRVQFYAKGNQNSDRLLIGVMEGETFTPVLEHILTDSHQSYTVSLGGYAGAGGRIAFKHNTQASNRVIYIDDVSLDPILDVPPLAVTPLHPLEGMTTFNQPTLSWQPANSGEPATGFRVYIDQNNPPTTLIYEGTNTYCPSPLLEYDQTYYWKVVPYNGSGETLSEDITISYFRTLKHGQLGTYFFHEGSPPPGWTTPTGGWFHNNVYPFYGEYNGGATTSEEGRLLVTPSIDIDTDDVIDFYARLGSDVHSDARFVQVQYSSDKLSWTDIGEAHNIKNNDKYLYYQTDLSELPPGTYFLALKVYHIPGTFQDRAIYIDHITGPKLTSLPILPPAPQWPWDFATDSQLRPDFVVMPNGEGGMPYGYKLYLDKQPNPTTLAATFYGDTYTLDFDLESGTTYYWKVTGFNDLYESDPGDIRRFTTKESETITTLPWSEGFEGGVLPDFWENTGWKFDYIDMVPQSGSKAAFSNTLDTELITRPVLIPDDGLEFIFSFWYRTENAVQPQSLDVSMDAGTGTFPISLLTLVDHTGVSYQVFQFSLKDYAGHEVQFKFEGKTGGGTSSFGIFLDDLRIAACPAPSGLTVNDITPSGAQIQWEAGADESNWNIEAGLAGFTPGTGAAIQSASGITDNPITLSGLPNNTPLQVYVQAYCNETQFSEWAGPISFTTLNRYIPQLTWPTASAIVYGSTLSATTLTGGSAIYDGQAISGTFGLANPSGIYPVSNDFNNQFPATFTPDDLQDYAPVDGYITIPIDPKELTITGSFTVADKEFDGSNEAQIENNQLLLMELVGSDNITLTALVIEFAHIGPGENIPVTIVSASLAGTFHENYTLSLVGAPASFGNILAPAHLASVQAVNNLTVVAGTSLESITDQLAATTIITDSRGTQHIVSLTWTIPGFDIEQSGLVYIAEGTFTLPDGVNPHPEGLVLNEVKANVTILQADQVLPYITAIQPVNAINVAFGTNEANALAQLPAQASIEASDENVYWVSLIWEIANYDGNTPGDYIATATFTLPNGVIQSDPETPLTLQTMVTVNDPPAQYSLILLAEPQQAGQTTGAGSYEAGTEVSVGVTIEEGFAFIHWMGPNEQIVSTDANFVFTMPAEAVTLTAHFEPVTIDPPAEFYLTLNVEPQQAGQTSGAGSYEAGTEVSVGVTIEEGFAFIHWMGPNEQIVSTDANFVFTMPAEAVTLTAHLEPLTAIPFVAKNGIKVFPNPSQGRFTITAQHEIVSVSIYNISGACVFNASQRGTTVLLDSTGLPKGIYLLEIQMGNVVERIKISLTH
jgi:hypothetical protein